MRAGEVVCLFPEGAISRNGQLGEFKRGYERAVDDVDGVIVPFYLRGLWGSRFSRSSAWLRKTRDSTLRRDVIVAFGHPLPIDTPDCWVSSCLGNRLSPSRVECSRPVCRPFIQQGVAQWFHGRTPANHRQIV